MPRPFRALGIALVCLASAAARGDEPAGGARRLRLQLAGLAASAPATQPASQPAVVPAAALAPAPVAAAVAEPPRGWWGRYRDFWREELERIIAMDIYGSVTTQLPKGYLTVKYQYNQREAQGRFDKDGKRIAIIPTIAFGDETMGKPCLDQKNYSDCLLAFDAGASGSGGSHEIQLSYGMTGRLDVYLDIPMQYHHVKFQPRVLAVDPDVAFAAGISYPPLDDRTTQTFETFVKRLGRPGINRTADHDLVLGDINAGFSWNFFRNPWISSAATYRLYFPTAFVAPPDNNLNFFTGPDIDAGNHAWAVGAGLGWDFRLPHFIHPNIDIILSFEWNFSYGFDSQREYPSVCPNVYDRNSDDGCNGFRPPEEFASSLFDPQHLYFPDLSHMRDQSSTYTYTPGFAQDMSVSLNLDLFGLGLGVGLGQAWAQKPEFDGDPNFIAMVENLEIVAPMRLMGLKLAASVPLFPLYVPAVLTFQYEHNLAGANALYFKNNFYVTLQGYVPDAYLVRRH